MREQLLEIRDYEGEGYQPLIDFGAWRVAILRFLDGLQPERQNTMERHMETDEVFVLTKGRGLLIMGGNGVQIDGIYPQTMEIGKVYNIKCGVWHTILLNGDASVVIVENRDTGQHNSEYADLSAEQRWLIMDIARREQFQ
jgi:mannose-6-phosphate isomerase-like protein (cupin superfamily)